jgi:hypothetical protein
MIEILIVAALVIWSAVVVFKKVFPKTSGSVFMSLSALCEARGWTRLATWLKPSMAGGVAETVLVQQQKTAMRKSLKFKR